MALATKVTSELGKFTTTTADSFLMLSRHKKVVTLAESLQVDRDLRLLSGRSINLHS